ncbi:MAG: VOC family protein [Chloroflexota bacterium]|nr:VOC family protein [Chloroflexota bacterium]
MNSYPIVHVDFPAQDTASAAKFYKEAFGWEITHEESVDYWMFSAAGGPGGGFVKEGGSYSPGAQGTHEIGKPIVYLGSEDIEADLARVEAAGGHTVVPRVEMGPYGAFAIFADSAGNNVGFFQAPAASA